MPYIRYIVHRLQTKDGTQRKEKYAKLSYCKRLEDGTVKQKHLAYMGKSLTNTKIAKIQVKVKVKHPGLELDWDEILVGHGCQFAIIIKKKSFPRSL